MGSVLATTIDFNSVEVKFDSTQIDVRATHTLGTLSGLTTGPDIDPANGHIKVRVDAGTLTINQAVDADSNGDVLLRAYVR